MEHKQEESDIRWKQRFVNFTNAFSHLKDAIALLEERELSRLELQGLLKAYEFTYELGWNVLKDFLNAKGIHGIVGSRDAVRHAFNNDLIDDGDTWIEMVNDRNVLSHVYDEELALRIASDIKNRYLQVFEQLIETMQSL